MGIDLKDQIIIIDEAHNIEDSCREEANCIIERKSLEKIIGELAGLLSSDARKRDNTKRPKFDEKQIKAVEYFLRVFKNLVAWIYSFENFKVDENSDENDDDLNKEMRLSQTLKNGSEITAELKSHGLGKQFFKLVYLCNFNPSNNPSLRAM